MMKTTVTVQMKHLFCSQVNPEEKVDSTEVLTVPVSFSSFVHTPPCKKQLKKAKVVQRKVFGINSLLDRVQEQEK